MIRRLVLGCAGGVLALFGAAPAHADDPPRFSVDDERIDEASGMVDLGDRTAIVNDSGDDPIVYFVDALGRTVGTTRYAASMVDTEAMSPAGEDEVWVGDIGDNDSVRDSIAVFKVPVDDGDRSVDAPRYELTYPDGAHDAETLLTGPDGRLWVVTKFVAGGAAYVAPRDLRTDRPNRLRKVTDVPGVLTDGAMFPDARHVLMRGYRSATLYTFPSFKAVLTFVLPRQQQGETLSIGPDQRVRIGSEGTYSVVETLAMPQAARRYLPGLPAAIPAASPSPSASMPSPTPSVTTTPDDVSRPSVVTGAVEEHPWLPAAFVVTLLFLGVLAIPLSRAVKARTGHPHRASRSRRLH